MQPLLVDRTEGVLRLTFNRPDNLNALTEGMLTTAADAVEASATDPEVRVVLLTGAGRAFSAGADLAVDGPKTATLDAANRLTLALRATPKPVVAAVNGLAAGVGCSFAIAADISIVTESAYLLLAFANIGLMPDGGATALLTAAIGRARATRMAMLAERIPAQQALDWGLITHTAPDDQFTTQVDTIVGKLATGPTASYAATKHALNQTSLALLKQATETERVGQVALFDTADFTEGVSAFHDKRTPKFAGR